MAKIHQKNGLNKLRMYFEISHRCPGCPELFRFSREYMKEYKKRE